MQVPINTNELFEWSAELMETVQTHYSIVSGNAAELRTSK